MVKLVIFISIQFYHRKNKYAITMLSRPTLAVSRHTKSPICDHGGPLTAPKRPETSPKPTDFPLSTSNVISVQSYHTKNYYVITMSSRPISTMYRHTISPICDQRGPPHSPKTAKKTPQTNRFSFVHLQRD